MSEWIDDSDLPKLQSIRLDESAFEGDSRDDRKTISNKPYGNNHYQYQWIEEKGDYSVQMNDNPRMTEKKTQWISVLDSSQFDRNHHFVHLH